MLNRRQFLSTSGLFIGSAGLGITDILAAATKTNKPVYGGWIPNQNATPRFNQLYFKQVGKNLAGTGAGKHALLWKYFERVTKAALVPHRQTVGDCVAQSFGLGIDILDAVQIAHGHGEWTAKSAIEVIYAGGRVEINGGKYTNDGMRGSWAARWCREYGNLLRQPYLNGKYDFTHYSGAKSRLWGHLCDKCTEWGGGVPNELEPLAKKHPIKTTTLVTSWTEARDAIYNGYPVAICSDVGFVNERDRDGFAKAKGTWYHCVLLAGVDDTNRRPGGLLLNSWGPNWIKGATRLDQPAGSFWVDANNLDKMLAQNDSFALSNYTGYPRQHLDYRLY